MDKVINFSFLSESELICLVTYSVPSEPGYNKHSDTRFPLWLNVTDVYFIDTKAKACYLKATDYVWSLKYNLRSNWINIYKSIQIVNVP